MKPVTIDNLDIKEHIRWAQDQALFDPTLAQEAQKVVPHPEILGTSIIFSSHLEGIFNWEKGMHPWANFAPPRYAHLSRRYFSYRLFLTIDWKKHDEEANDEEANGEEANDEEESGKKKHSKDMIQYVLAQKSPYALFDKDKKTILSMLECIQSINDMLEQIVACKLQYQKG